MENIQIMRGNILVKFNSSVECYRELHLDTQPLLNTNRYDQNLIQECARRAMGVGTDCLRLEVQVQGDIFICI